MPENPKRISQRSLRYRLWQQLVTDRSHTHISVLNRFIILIIILTLLIISLQTEPNLSTEWQVQLHIAEYFLWGIFIIEWCVRLWVCPCNPRFAQRQNPYWAWILVPVNALDSATVFIGLVVLFLDNQSNGLWWRFFRVILIFRYFRFTAESKALYFLIQLFKRQAAALFSSLSILAMITYLMAFLLWLVEKDVNPGLSSIPRALWWATITISTTGYGDVIPLTTTGRIITAVFTFISLSLIALPGAIMAAGFMQILQEEKQKKMEQHHQSKK